MAPWVCFQNERKLAGLVLNVDKYRLGIALNMHEYVRVLFPLLHFQRGGHQGDGVMMGPLAGCLISLSNRPRRLELSRRWDSQPLGLLQRQAWGEEAPSPAAFMLIHCW